MDVINSGSRLGNLQEAWSLRADLPIGDWVQLVSTAYFNCNTSLMGAADLLETQPAELQAVLDLASLDEADLAVVSQYNPPVTTWFFIAECPSEHLKHLLDEIKRSDHPQSSAGRAQTMILSFLGPTRLDAVAKLDSRDFAHLAKKAASYGALNPKGRQALSSFSTRLKQGQPLTPKQVDYAYGLIQQLVDATVVSRNSPDGDIEIMERVLAVVDKS